MVVYKRAGNDFYSYDFISMGVRYSGSTGTSDFRQAEIFEQVVRSDVALPSSFCKAIIKKARRNFGGRLKSKRGYVYMLRSGYFIKIGHSIDPAERLRTINNTSPEECELLLYFPGEQRLEQELHKEFSACHYRGEWFFLCGKLKSFVGQFLDAGQDD